LHGLAPERPARGISGVKQLHGLLFASYFIYNDFILMKVYSFSIVVHNIIMDGCEDTFYYLYIQEFIRIFFTVNYESPRQKGMDMLCPCTTAPQNFENIRFGWMAKSFFEVPDRPAINKEKSLCF
jgi:hypothetical protein